MVELNRFERVWDAVTDDRAETEHMRLRSELMDALRAHITANGWGQTDAARIMGVSQPRISNLIQGRISLFSLDALIDMASAAGLNVHMAVDPPVVAVE